MGWHPETCRPGKGTVFRMGWQSRDKSSGKRAGFPDGMAVQIQVVREKGRFSGWDGSPGTCRPGKGTVFRMGWQSGDMSSGKRDGFPDGMASRDMSSGKRACFPDGMAVQRQVVRETGCFPGRDQFSYSYSATGMSFTRRKTWYEDWLSVGTQIIVSDVRVRTMYRSAHSPLSWS